MRTVNMDGLNAAIEQLELAREYVWLVEAADNSRQAERDAQAAYDYLSAMIARAIALLPPGSGLTGDD